MISIIIPSYNNLKYLKLCIESIKKNSKYNNEILVHVNEGKDGSIDYLKLNNIKFTHTIENVGLCVACNLISKKSFFNYILYAHDDMYFLPDWDFFLINKVKSLKTNKFYISSIMINGDTNLKGHLNLNAGETIENFNEKYLLENYGRLKHQDFQGSTWAPHLIHKEMWNKINGFSEEFSPGAGSDPDLNMKLWKEGVRIFQCISDSRVYHFGSITIRKKENDMFKKNQGSRANKIFLLKWGISIKTFKKFYLKAHYIHNDVLDEPIKSLDYYLNILKDKILFAYYRLFSSIKLK
jgi:glycosyltransferase involved in cell wall biosynthesis